MSGCFFLNTVYVMRKLQRVGENATQSQLFVGESSSWAVIVISLSVTSVSKVVQVLPVLYCLQSATQHCMSGPFAFEPAVVFFMLNQDTVG